MDPYLLAIKYIFNKNQTENTDTSLNDFFENGTSFPKLISILFGIEKIPGVVFSKNKYQLANNNSKALYFLGQNNPFFKSYQIDFNNEKNQISLAQLIISKVYFKITRTSFLKKCNEFIQPAGLVINHFREFNDGSGFMKLLNVASNGTIPPEMKFDNNDQLIEELTTYLHSLNIYVLIDKSALIPTNSDLLMYQALIIIDNAEIKPHQEKLDNNSDETSSNNNTNSNKKVSFESDPSSKINFSDSGNNLQQTNESSIDELSESSEKTFSFDDQDSFESSEISNDEEQKGSQISMIESKAIPTSDVYILPKSSYINIVNNIMEENHLKEINTFADFQKGEILPKLVEILLKEKVPNIVENPTGYDEIMNNMSSLYFINSKNPDINPRDYNMTNENDIKNLIRILIKKYMITKECSNQMRDKTNLILQHYQRTANNFNKDWDDGTNFAALLNFLTKNEISYLPDEKLNISILKSMFANANCNCVLDENSLFGKTDELVILYQVKIILNEVSIRNELIPTNDTISDASQANNSDKQSQSDNTFKDGYIYEKDSCPILRLFNLIGRKIGLHFDNMNDIVNGEKIPLFVENLMGVSNIPGITKNENSELDNFNTVINYLNENNKAFRYSLFDFDDKSNISANIQWFSTTLLEQYFLKKSKKKIIQKASELIGEKILFSEIKKVFLFGKGFYKILGSNVNENNNYYDEDSLLLTFKKVDVPFIMDEDSLTNVNNDYICFQLQLIFDKIIKPEENEKPKAEINEEKFVSKIVFNPEEQKNDANDTNISDIINDIRKAKESSNGIPNEYQHNSTNALDPSKLVQFISEHNLIDKIESQRFDEEKKNELNDIKGKLKPTESKIFLNFSSISNEKIEDNTEDPNFPLTYDLYSYEISNDKKNKSNNKDDKTLKSYHIFQYDYNMWKFKPDIWKLFITDNQLKEDDILYWVLLTPSCITDDDIETDKIYQLAKTISMSKKIQANLTQSMFVEIMYIGNLKDIRNDFKLNTIASQNEKMAFIQLRYTSSYKGKNIINNMQSILSLQANYILATYPIISLNDSFLLINNSIHQAYQSFYFNNRHIGMSFLMTNLPYPLDPAKKDIVHTRGFLKTFDATIQKNNAFKMLVKNFQYLDPTVNCIDLYEVDTYANFLQSMINYVQKFVNKQSKLSNITFFLNYFITKSFNSIMDQKQMNNFMYHISNHFQETKKDEKKPKPLYKLIEGEIVKDDDEWTKFLKTHSINEKDTLFIIFWAYSNQEDYEFINRILSKTEINDPSNDSQDLTATIKYCGTFENIAEQFNIKVKNKASKSHIAFLYSNNSSNYSFKTVKYFNFYIANKCDLIITIENSQFQEVSYPYNKYSHKFSKVLNAYSDLSGKTINYMFIVKQYLEFRKDSISIFIDNIPMDCNKYLLDMYDNESLTSIISEILQLLPNKENIAKSHNKDQFDNIDIIFNNFTFIIFENLAITYDEDYNKKYELIDENEVLKKIAYFIRDDKVNTDKINSIDGRFLDLNYHIHENKQLNEFLLILRSKAIQYFINPYVNECIDIINKKGIDISEICQLAKDYIASSITYINDDLLQYLKASCKNKIEERLLEEAESFCNKADIGISAKIFIWNSLKKYFGERIMSCIADIESFFNETKVFKRGEKDDVDMTKNQIEQNSIKYILTVRESISELTIEIENDDDIEKEIPTDY